MKKLLKVEIAKVDKGWGEDPLARKARALAWGQWKLGEAYALLEPALAGRASPEVATLAREIEARFDSLARKADGWGNACWRSTDAGGAAPAGPLRGARGGGAMSLEGKIELDKTKDALLQLGLDHA